MSPDSPSRPIRLALVGAGIFMHDAHLPSLLRLPDHYQIVAVYSRSEQSARKLAERLPAPVQLFTDYAKLLAEPTIEAVDIVLPIPTMPAYVAQALASGKHVISEKPIAPDLAQTQTLLAAYAQHAGTVWMVGENWRYESAFVRSAELVQAGAIGTPHAAHWAIFAPILPGNKYFGSTWRESGGLSGGYLLDGGVHHAAALRMVIGEISEVSATVKQVAPYLPPADTIAAQLRFANGALGAYLAGYSLAAPWPPYLHVIGDQGALRMQRGEVEITRDGQSEVIRLEKFDGVEKELVAFAAAIRDGAPHRNSPQEAARDLAVVDALLRAAADGRPVAVAAV
ncbi:MAG TPA: Gfo/Idh/MocA family oxidoreductase [Caldilineaceae bacterium]|nr:Gfo/Idh/MocA family oxidoreductase [Caldilineaceae bacterium]